MGRQLLRIVSATLVATFAVLASAAALCLVPCELAPAHAGASGPQADHCAGAAVTESSAAAIAGADDSCSDQHGWDGPPADRLGSRTSVLAALATSAPIAALAADVEVSTLPGAPAPVPAAPPPLFVPLRI